MTRDEFPGRDILGGLVAKPLKTVTRGGSAQNAEFRNLQYIASYNWIDADEPTIIVPGAFFVLDVVF